MSLIALYHVCSVELQNFVLDTTLCDKVCHWPATARWFSLGTPVSFTNNTDHHIKVALKTINQPTNPE